MNTDEPTQPVSRPPSPPEGTQGLDPAELLKRALQSDPATGSAKGWTPPAPEELARLLPQYQIESLLGRGGMGAVYKGRQTGLDRAVAIKLLPSEMAADAQFVTRFQREARTLARLQHPGIVAVYDFGQTSEGHLYFVMEFVDGTDLAHIIHGVGLEPPQVLEVITQICDALQYAHTQGVIHRDIKPANVLLTKDGRAKLADFGLARPLQEDSGALTGSNVVMGTPDYIAPEQMTGHADHRADLYSLGVMLYEMLTGQTPRGAFAPASQRVHVDVRLDQVVLRALQQEPERRYQQASEMKTDVDTIRSSPMQRTAKAGEKTKSARRGRLALAAIVLLPLLAIAGWFVWQKVGHKTLIGTVSKTAAYNTDYPADLKVPVPDWLRKARAEGGPLAFQKTADVPGLFDLGGAAQFDDFVEVFCQDYGWLAVRRNGEVWGKSWGNGGTGASIGPIQARSIVQGNTCQIVDKDGTLHRLYGGKIHSKPASHWGNLSVSAVTLDRATGLSLGGNLLSLAMDQEGMILGTDVALPAGMILPPSDFFQNAADIAAGQQAFFASEPSRPLRTWDVKTGKPFPLKAVPEDVVQMDVKGAAMLLRQNGSILSVRPDGSMNGSDLAPPPGVEPAIRVKLGTGAYAQKPDGTWIGWAGRTGDVATVAGLAATLGPLIDLSAGEFQFSDGDYKRHPLSGEFLLYIVPNAPNSSVSSSPSSATKATPFINTLGMKFVPVPITGGPTSGQRVLFSVSETRVQDYEAFAKETKREWPKPSFEQGPMHPAVMVSWQDAAAYCLWLTVRERMAGKLTANEAYRLPSDHEWSCAVGIGDREDAAKLPSEKNHKLADVFPWGNEWPPPAGTGNFSGEETMGEEIDKKNQKSMAGYRDEFIATAQVGSFPPDRLGLHDLSGNAWEWCEDWFDATQKDRIIRGGSWNNAEHSSLLSSDRTRSGPGSIRNNIVGFRCVLASTTPPAAISAKAVWKKVPPQDARMAAQAAANDGWIKADRWYLSLTAPDQKFFNGAVRLRFRWEKDGALSLNLRREQVPTGPGQRHVFFQCLQGGQLVLHPEGFQTTSAVEARIVPKPLPGSEGTLEFAVIGNKAVARVNGVLLATSQALTGYGPGGFDLGNGYHDRLMAVKDVEYTNLDGVPNPEAVLGWEFPASAGTPLALPADRFAALRVLEKGGKITIRTATGAVQTITSSATFQNGEFTLESVQVQTSQPNDFNDEDMALLTGQPKLKRVELNNTKVTGAGLAVLKTLPALDFVTLNGIKPLRDEDLLPLKECRSLVRLELSNTGDKLSSAGLEPIFELDQLRDLALGRMTLGSDVLKKFGGLRKLEKLNVAGITMSAAALEQLKALPDLEWLTLDLNPLDRPVDFAAFPRLTRITTSGLTSEGLKNLAFATHLESLDISLQPLSPDLLTQLAKVCPGLKELTLNVDRALPPGTSFTSLPKLESLIISVFRGDSLFDDAALLDLAKEAKLKRVVIVSAPRLTSQGLAAFKKLRPDVKIDGYALPQAPQAPAEGGQQTTTSPDRAAALRVLARGGNVTIKTKTGTVQTVISGTPLPEGDFSLQSVAMVTVGPEVPNDFNDDDMLSFGRLPNLQFIHLNRTAITGVGLAVLKTLPSLTSLILTGNERLRDEDLSQLKECRKLNTLTLNYTDMFTPAAMEHLANLGQLQVLSAPDHVRSEDVKHLLRLQNLRILRLSGNAPLSAAALEQLQALPAVQELTLYLEMLDRPMSFAAFPGLTRIYSFGLTSDAVKSLATVPHLEFLIVNASSKLTSGSLSQLAATPLTSLKTLVLKLNHPLPPGEPFAPLPKLEEVRVGNHNTNAFDDASLLGLAKVATLKTVKLEVPSPRVTSAGLATFKKLRPEVKIEGSAAPSESKPSTTTMTATAPSPDALREAKKLLAEARAHGKAGELQTGRDLVEKAIASAGQDLNILGDAALVLANELQAPQRAALLAADFANAAEADHPRFTAVAELRVSLTSKLKTYEARLAAATKLVPAHDEEGELRELQAALELIPDGKEAAASLQQNPLHLGHPLPGRAFIHPLGHRFMPVDGVPNVLFSIWETRVKDFEQFVKETHHDMSQPRAYGANDKSATWQQPGFEQAGDHPVVMVSHDDADAFCRWLTEKERTAGRLLPGQVYRLPTDREWSAAMGVLNEPGEFPEYREFPKDVVTWEKGYPPRNAENLFGQYDDFPNTAPVGSGTPNRFGLYDLLGNVVEMCADPWTFYYPRTVVRGGSFLIKQHGMLQRSNLLDSNPSMNVGRTDCGFRCVLDLKTAAQRQVQLTLEAAVEKFHALSLSRNQPKSEIHTLVNDEMVLLNLSRYRGSYGLQSFAGVPVTHLFISCPSESDQSVVPLQKMPLKVLSVMSLGNHVSDRALDPLRELPLQWLNLEQLPQDRMNIRSLAALSKMKLRGLNLVAFGNLESLEPLRGMPLETLRLHMSMMPPLDLTPVKDAPLSRVYLPRSITLERLLLACDWWAAKAQVFDEGTGSVQQLLGKVVYEAALTGDPERVEAVKVALKSKLASAPSAKLLVEELDKKTFQILEDFALRITRHLNGDRNAFDGLYQTFNGHSYLQQPPSPATPMSYDEAKEFARKLGGHLLVVTSAAENDFVIQRLTAGVFQKGNMLGLEKTSGDRPAWTWVTGEPFEFQNWWDGKDPINDKSTNMATIMQDNQGQWAWRAGSKHGGFDFIIEWDTPSPEPLVR